MRETLTDMTLTVSRKAGPDGQLFGGVGAKAVMKELLKFIGNDFLSQKGVKITELMDGNGKKIRGDIKHTGEFGARITLAKNVAVKFAISVEADG